MTTISGLEVIADVRRILNDATATVFTEAVIVANINMAVRAVMRKSPAACYSSPVAFKENGVVLTGTGAAGVVQAGDVIAVDAFYQDEIAHYAAHLCFSQTDRSTVNAEFASRERKNFKEPA